MRVNVIVFLFTVIASQCVYASEDGEKIGSWNYVSSEDKMDDQIGYIAIATGKGGSIAFKCDTVGANTVYVGFYAKQFLGAGPAPYRMLKFRIDKNQPAEFEWQYDDGHAHIFNKELASAIAKDVMRGNTMLINAYTYDNKTVTAEIDITGADRALSRLFNDCKK